MSISAMLCVFMYAAQAAGSAESGDAASLALEASFEATPVLLEGRIPAPDLLIALSQLPTDLAQRRAMWKALTRAVDGLPDASVRLSWLAPSACDALMPAPQACATASTPTSLDDSTRAAFKLFLAGAEQGLAAAAEVNADSIAAHAITAVVPGGGKSTVPAHNGPALRCRQTHVVLIGTDVAPGTLRPTIRSSLGAGSPAPVVHRVLLDGQDPGARIDEAMQTALAESMGPDGIRTIALVLVAASTGGSSKLLAARYNARGWHGELAPRIVNNAVVDITSAPWGRQSMTEAPHTTATLLNERNSVTRVIVSSQGEGRQFQGMAWRWAELSQQQRARLNQDARQRPDDLGEQRLDWLRGAREDEQARGGVLRDRGSGQADMLGTVPWSAPSRFATQSTDAEPTMIYTAGNGGLLHAFDAESGSERFAYVPQGAIDKVAALSNPQYSHRPSVAGSPFTADWREGNQARRWVFGLLGAGGRGYFALDVSSLAGFGDESQGARQVRLDTTHADDHDLGHVFGTPVTAPGAPWRSAAVMRMNDGRMALLLGNGFGSKSGRAALLLQYLDGARELRKIPAGDPGGNGLGPVRLVDVDGDQKSDFAYAGDLRGHVWKFDLQDPSPTQWRVAGNGRPIFTAQGAQGLAQPLSTAPAIWPHPKGGRMLVVATGRLLTESDRSDTATQSIYGIHDRDDDEQATGTRADLRRRGLQTVARQADASQSQSQSQSQPQSHSHSQSWAQKTSSDKPPGPSVSPRGWYIDLPLPGERALAHPEHFDGQLIDIVSTIPAPVPASGAAESCEPAKERQFRNTFRALDGEPPQTAIYGTPEAPLTGGRIELSAGPGAALRSLSRETRTNFDGADVEAARMRLGFTAVRPAWRQLQ